MLSCLYSQIRNQTKTKQKTEQHLITYLRHWPGYESHILPPRPLQISNRNSEGRCLPTQSTCAWCRVCHSRHALIVHKSAPAVERRRRTESVVPCCLDGTQRFESDVSRKARHGARDCKQTQTVAYQGVESQKMKKIRG